ncbi:Cytidine and deoxycytidylate deaminase zinc-binding region [Zhouia amylolytica]|uniref:CMP/dCMP deaminase n=2 Tax=Zhouia amylolytica TaxID=376730 RepID=W2UMW8_9FLAO|nr:nucleoside deaminase [Zhouia amylolytica]ETN95284.1 CMP/dCMP deaminase [Zhouia amylolytica AD3]MCQ0112748.1 nucleoside deaminase [Zhouia amylolytica]SFT14780.1 Cytidine and deoxycytidylate deaminase zinc-binding region [Zhouia amylolytica]
MDHNFQMEESFSNNDRFHQKYLLRCVELAKKALEAGDKPFGSILVNKEGTILAEARNRVNEIHSLSHPEFELAQWALENLTPIERKQSILYTSGEHCPMCAGANGWAGIGKIVYASSAAQLSIWLKGLQINDLPLNLIPIQEIIKDVEIVGPFESFYHQIKTLHFQYYSRQKKI